jgi:hypothetical protein
MIVADRLRAPSAVDLAAAAYKDWLHVNVFDFARGRVSLVNVSLHGDPVDPRSLAAGAVLLGDVEEGWVQRVEVIGAAEATAGRDEIAIEDVAAILLDDAGGGVGVHGRLPGDRGGFDLAAFPSAAPVVAEAATPFGSGWIAWRAVPRMTVTGWVSVDGEEARVDEMAAYHDHNWGRWYWGDDAGWEWGAFLSADGCAFVSTRPTDRAHRTGGTALRAVVGGRARSFHPRTVEARLGGTLREPASRGPGAMAALHSCRAHPQLPSRVRVVADDGYDRVELEASLAHAAQIVVAEPARPGYGFIHELVGEFRYRARIAGAETTGHGLVALEYVD